MRKGFARRRLRPPTLSRLLRSARGITTLEFAFIVPVFLLIVMGVVEFSLIMLVTAAMESATATTSRTGKTGYAAAGKSREQTIIDSIKDHTSGLLDPTKIVITSKIYSAFDKVNDPEPYIDANGNGSYNAGESYTDINGNGQWDSDMGATGIGSAGDIVVYIVTYPWDIHTPVIGAFTGDPFNITVRAVVKNEPFGDGS